MDPVTQSAGLARLRHSGGLSEWPLPTDAVEKLRKQSAAKIRPNAIYEQKSVLNAIAMQLRWSLAACTSTSAFPPNLFSILKRTALKILAGRRKNSFSTASVKLRRTTTSAVRRLFIQKRSFPALQVHKRA